MADSQFVRERRGRNHQVSRADDIFGAAQVCMSFGVNVGDFRVEFQAGKQRTSPSCARRGIAVSGGVLPMRPAASAAILGESPHALDHRPERPV